MKGFTFSTTGDHGAEEGVRLPETDRGSKEVMLRAENRDELDICSVERKFSDNGAVPEKVVISQRTNTYFGPKLRATSSEDEEFVLTAPGPDCQLLIWSENLNHQGNRKTWKKLAEVRARLVADQEGYHLCNQCNEPFKTAEHERLASLGLCPNVS